MVTFLHYLHVLFAFAWFGAVFAAHWNTLHARRSKDWASRAALFDVNRGLSAMVSLPALLGVGILGNVFAMQMGYKMGHTPLFMVVDALWVVLLAVTLAMEMPATGALGALAHAAADAASRGGHGEPAGWGRELARWRTANAVQLLLYAVLLALMISPWGTVS
jgi:hypothetical protein